MKIFVTGANGFVGRHLVARLVEQGHAVTAGVRRVGAAPEGAEEYLLGDLGRASALDGAFVGHDVVVHLAARVHVMDETSADPLSEFRRVNAEGTRQLAEAAAEQGVSRFVFLSSIKVNGEGTTDRPYRVSDAPNPVDPYGISKLEAELALREIQENSPLEVVIVRTPLVYGPGVGGNFVKLLSIARKGVPLPLGGVHNRRTMTSVWNLADLLERASTEPQAAGALVLAGDSESLSTPDLIRAMSAALGKPSRVWWFPAGLLTLAGKLTGKQAVVHRLIASLEVEVGTSNGWEWVPPVAIRDGLARTAAWYSTAGSESR